VENHIRVIKKRRLIVSKYYGSYDGLQNLLALTGIGGEWRDLGNQQQYVANTGAILNWWRSTKTVNFQGKPPAAMKELEAAFFAVNPKKEIRPCRV
jgi:hypothetical protein